MNTIYQQQNFRLCELKVQPFIYTYFRYLTTFISSKNGDDKKSVTSVTILQHKYKIIRIEVTKLISSLTIKDIMISSMVGKKM